MVRQWKQLFKLLSHELSECESLNLVQQLIVQLTVTQVTDEVMASFLCQLLMPDKFSSRTSRPLHCNMISAPRQMHWLVFWHCVTTACPNRITFGRICTTGCEQTEPKMIKSCVKQHCMLVAASSNINTTAMSCRWLSPSWRD